VFHTDAIAKHYPKARVAQIGDSLAFVFHRPISLASWGTNEVFPPFFRIGDRRWTMVEFLTKLARAHPDVTVARFNHASDEVQERFYEAVGGARGGFEPRLRRNYRSYLACGYGHCAFPSPEFYSLEVGGVSLRDWVADIAAGKDVDCPLCSR
jgi:hypothetical protein